MISKKGSNDRTQTEMVYIHHVSHAHPLVTSLIKSSATILPASQFKSTPVPARWMTEVHQNPLARGNSKGGKR